MNTDTPASFLAIQDPDLVRMRAALAFAYAAVAALRAHRAARGALVLGYISPLLVRKPDPDRPVPKGWTSIAVSGHICPELDGVWWVCDEHLWAQPSGLDFANLGYGVVRSS